MSAAKRAKQLGAPTLAWVAEKSGSNYRHLFEMFKANPKKFDILVAGCVKLYGGKDEKQP